MYMLLVALIIATSFYLNAGGFAFDDSFVPGGRNQYDVTAAPFSPPSQHIEAAKGMGSKYLGLGTSQQSFYINHLVDQALRVLLIVPWLRHVGAITSTCKPHGNTRDVP